MLLLGKTQKKHPGDLPPTVPDLPLHPQLQDGLWCPRVDVDAFATSTACCDLDLWPLIGWVKVISETFFPANLLAKYWRN